MKRAFISFDFDHDEDLRTMLAGQAKHPDTPFEFANWSVRDELSGDWKARVRSRIRATDFTIVICGEWTHTATGVSHELTITREEKKPYFLLWGRPDKDCKKPKSADADDKIYKWTWDNVKALVNGSR
jgi:hypothetical protein